LNQTQCLHVSTDVDNQISWVILEIDELSSRMSTNRSTSALLADLQSRIVTVNASFTDIISKVCLFGHFCKLNKSFLIVWRLRKSLALDIKLRVNDSIRLQDKVAVCD
jgi:hypothetical protein